MMNERKDVSKVEGQPKVSLDRDRLAKAAEAYRVLCSDPIFRSGMMPPELPPEKRIQIY